MQIKSRCHVSDDLKVIHTSSEHLVACCANRFQKVIQKIPNLKNFLITVSDTKFPGAKRTLWKKVDKGEVDLKESGRFRVPTEYVDTVLTPFHRHKKIEEKFYLYISVS